MARFTRVLAGILAAAAVIPVAAQAPVTIKLATIVPTNSIWHDALRSLGDAWKRDTEGRVTLQLFPGGIRGTEPSYLRLMAFDDIQAALLLPPGLSEIDPAFGVLGLPFFFDSDAEVQAVLEKLTPALSQRLEAKRFHLINWGHAGWVQVFSKRPIKTLSDLKQGQLYTTEGSDAMVRCYQTSGFHPVPKNFNDIPAALKSPTGGIDTVPAPPLGAATMFFRDAPNMLELRVAPLISAIVMNDRAWSRLAPADRTKLLASAAAMQKQVMSQAPAVDAKEIAGMKARGLTVTTFDQKGMAEIREAASTLTGCMRGTVVPADVYDLAVKERDAYRQSASR